MIKLKLTNLDIKLLNIIESDFDINRTYTEDEAFELLDRILDKEVELAQDGKQDYADEFIRSSSRSGRQWLN